MRSSRKSSKRVVSNVQETDWILDPDSQCYYRYYADVNGAQQIEWYTEQETPRTDTAQAENLDQTDLANEEYPDDEPSGYTHTTAQGGFAHDTTDQELAGAAESLAIEEDYDEAEEDQHDPESQSATASSSKGKSHEKKHSRRDEKKPSSSKTKKDAKGSVDRKGKGKGKEKETRAQDEPGEPFFERDQQAQHEHQHQHQHQAQHQHQRRGHRQKRTHGHQAAPTGTTGGTTQGDTHPVDAGYGARSAGGVASEVPYYPPGEEALQGTYHEEPILQHEIPDEIPDSDIPTDAGFASGFVPEEDDENDAVLNKVLAQSREAAYPNYGGQLPGYAHAESSSAQEDYEQLQEEDDDDGTVTPTRDNPGLETDMVISGTYGNYEAIDSRYQVEGSHKFQPGEVFKILWSEPQGQSRDNFRKVDIETYTDRMHLTDEMGDKFYVGFRRFIVVANDEGHCTCVPILTYMRQGCKKKGVKPNKHGIIYDSHSKSKPLEGEPKLGFKPIRLEIRAAGEKLARESRVNYSKLVTVEHNVKVFFIGSINARDFDDIVPNAVDKCWQDKIRKRVKKGLERDVPRH